jgi:CDP-diacylglycerol--glycerol-3-phosphate 3-phosphatidyltransferase
MDERSPRTNARRRFGPDEPDEADGPARIRDMPAPRRARGMFGPALGTAFAWPYRWALSMLYRAGFRPAQITLLSLATNALVGWLLLTGRRLLPAWLLLAAGLLDVFDGGVARLRGEASRRGAFLDSVFDRVSDVVVFGCLFWSLAGQGRTAAAALALAAVLVTLLVSHLRAEAEALGLSLTEGMMQRLERYVLLIVGLGVPGALLPVLAILTALGTVTVLQRSTSAWTKLARDRRRPVQELE